MAANIQGVPFRFTGSALPNFAEEYNKPQSLAAKLLEAQLKNKHDSIINQYLPRSEEARINNILANTAGTQSNTGLDDYRRQIYQQKINATNSEQSLNQKLMEALPGNQSFSQPNESSVDNSQYDFSIEGPGIAASASAQDTFPGRFPGKQRKMQPAPEESIVNEGNSSLYNIDQMFNTNPLARKFLEGKGFKQSQVTKYDPKTRSTSVVTTYPSGKVSVRLNKGNNDVSVPLTNTIKTQMQGIIAGVPKVNTKIDALKAAPSPIDIIGYKPDQRAKHDALIRETAETYAKAKGWPNTNESIKTAIEILDRHKFESDAAYRKRLDEIKISLGDDLANAEQTLHPEIASQKKSTELTFNPATGRLE